jgi:hypothetical protein
MKTTPASDASPVLIELIDGQPTTTSLDVAAHFGKRHCAVVWMNGVCRSKWLTGILVRYSKIHDFKDLLP